MDEKKLSIVLEALAEKIDELEFDLSLRDLDIKRLKEENAELKRQRDALCRKDIENG